MSGHGISHALFLSAYLSTGILVSLLIAVFVRLFGHRIDRLEPLSQSRIWFALTVAPAAVTAAVAIGSSADWLLYGPTSFCIPLGHVSAEPSWLLLGIGCFVAWRFSAMTMLLLKGFVRSAGLRDTLQNLDAVRLPGAEDQTVHVLPREEPQAFLLGLRRPKVCLSAGLLTRPYHEVQLVLAHELAHIRCGHPRTRLIALLASFLHAPGLAESLRRKLIRAQEAVADSEAARQEQDRLSLAEILVSWARIQPPALGALHFHGGDLEFRVLHLLKEQAGPGFSLTNHHVAAAAIAGTALSLAFGRALHLYVQMLLRLP
jgi:Zn-dependent protease with chaperone function